MQWWNYWISNENLNAIREKRQITYAGITVRLIVEFLSVTADVMRQYSHQRVEVKWLLAYNFIPSYIIIQQ